jgi:hypothetical protein
LRRFVEAGVEASANLVRGVCAALSFTARDDDTRRCDTDDSGQTE